MLKIRFIRVGRKHDPSFRLVVTDSRKPPRSGAYLENLGYYDPLKKGSQLKADRIEYWLSKGAKISDTAYNLLISANIMRGKKKNVSAKSKKVKKEEQPALAAEGAEKTEEKEEKKTEEKEG
jgi:small subunit ribosomal protein S16